VAILASLIGAMIMGVAAILALTNNLTSNFALQVALAGVVVLAPVPLSILTLIYSLSSGKQTKHT
jgi:hypothetical protein